MSDFLNDMAHLSEQRAAALSITSAQLDRPLVPLRLQRFDLIAEIKGRSPSEGTLNDNERNRVAQATAYIEGGAAAISVLTEPSRFAGELSHLDEISSIAAQFRVPTMRKDFLTAPSQIVEGRAAGASGVLLIAAMLDDKLLRSMLDCAWEHGMFVLLEAFDDADLARMSALLESAEIADKAAGYLLLMGVNTRNLRTLEVDAQRLRKLAPLLPAGVRCVAESGLKVPADAAAAMRGGYQLGLVGTALMRSAEPQQLVADMLAAGREQ